MTNTTTDSGAATNVENAQRQTTDLNGKTVSSFYPDWLAAKAFADAADFTDQADEDAAFDAARKIEVSALAAPVVTLQDLASALVMDGRSGFVPNRAMALAQNVLGDVQ